MKCNVKFSKNWNNKLDSDIFTTIRKDDKKKTKFHYYKQYEGKDVNIWLNGRLYRTVKLLNVELKGFYQLPYGFLCIDTGTDYPFDIFREFGIDTYSLCVILTFKKSEKA